MQPQTFQVVQQKTKGIKKIMSINRYYVVATAMSEGAIFQRPSAQSSLDVILIGEYLLTTLPAGHALCVNVSQ